MDTNKKTNLASLDFTLELSVSFSGGRFSIREHSLENNKKKDSNFKDRLMFKGRFSHFVVKPSFGIPRAMIKTYPSGILAKWTENFKFKTYFSNKPAISKNNNRPFSYFSIKITTNLINNTNELRVQSRKSRFSSKHGFQSKSLKQDYFLEKKLISFSTSFIQFKHQSLLEESDD